MNFRYFIKPQFLLVFTISLFIAGCQQTTPLYYSSEAQGFAIQLPNIPRETVQEAQTDAGKLVFHSVETEAEDHEYAISVIEYPASLVQEKGSKAILEDASEGGVSSIFGTLLDRKDISIGEYSGINQTVETVDKIFMANVFLIENRLYMIVVAGPKNTFSDDKAQGFLNAFELLPRE